MYTIRLRYLLKKNRTVAPVHLPLQNSCASRLRVMRYSYMTKARCEILSELFVQSWENIILDPALAQ